MNVKLTLMREIKKTEIETVDQPETVPKHFTIQIIRMDACYPCLPTGRCVIRVFMFQFAQESHPYRFVQVPELIWWRVAEEF